MPYGAPTLFYSLFCIFILSWRLAQRAVLAVRYGYSTACYSKVPELTGHSPTPAGEPILMPAVSWPAEVSTYLLA